MPNTPPIEIEIATYEADDRPIPTRRVLDWAGLVDLVTSHAPTPCTRATCGGAQCPRKRVAAWSPVVIEGQRLNRCVRGVTALVVDLDHLEASDQGALAERVHASGHLWCLASSHQHAEDAPRFRLVIALSRPATPEEYPRLRRSVLSRLALPGDPRTGDLSRIYYLPTSRADCPPETASGGESPLDVDAELAAAPPDPAPELPPTRGDGAVDWVEEAGGPPSEADLARLDEALAALPPRGGGHGATFQAFALIFHDFGLSIESGWSHLVAWNAGCGQPHAPRELERQLYRVAAARRDTPRGWRRGGDLVAGIVADLLRPPEGSWHATLAQAQRDVAEALGVGGDGDARVPEPLGEPYELLAARESAGVDWVVRGVLRRGGVAVLGGRSKIGKSWILTALAISAASGRPLFGAHEVPQPRRVFYLYAEDSETDVRSHAAALRAPLGLGVGDLGSRWTVQAAGRYLDLSRDSDLALVAASVRHHGGADVVVLEPLRDLHGAAENDSDAMAGILRRLHVLGTLLGGAAVVVSHHESKPSQGAAGRKGGERLRGSGVVYAAASTVISVTPVAQTPTTIETLVEVEVRGARAAEPHALVLTIEDDPRGQCVAAGWRVAPPGELATAPTARADLEAAARHPADMATLLAEVERHALGTLPELGAWRERGCRCPPGSVIHARDLYTPGGAHRLGIPRARQRAALLALVARGLVARVGGEHGELVLGADRLSDLREEMAG